MCRHLIPAFGRQGEVDLCEFKARLVFYKASFRTVRAVTQRIPDLGEKKKRKKCVCVNMIKK